MSNDEEIQQRIIDAIKKKMGTPLCPLCHHSNWTIGHGYTVLTISNHPTNVQLGGQVYPLVAMICSNCGNCHLINLLTLGFNSDDLNSMGLSKYA